MRAFRRSIAVLMLTAPAGAQSWKTLDVSRQLRDSTEHSVRVRYPVGRISLRSTSDAVIYSMHLRYDENRMYPVHAYDADTHRATLGFESDNNTWSRSRKALDESQMDLVLSDRVPLGEDKVHLRFVE